MNRSLLETLRETLALVPRWPALLALAVLTTLAVVVRPMQAALMEGVGSNDILALYRAGLPGNLMPIVIWALVMLMLARTMLARDAGNRGALWGRWIGLFLLQLFVGEVLTMVLTVAIMIASEAPIALTYGTVAAGGVADIAVFPLCVGVFLAAAGAREPRLGAVVAGSFGAARFAYFWYAVCALLFPALMVFAFGNLLGPVDRANELTGNLVQSAITSIGSLLQMLLAIIAARAMLPPASREAEAFA